MWIFNFKIRKNLDFDIWILLIQKNYKITDIKNSKRMTCGIMIFIYQYIQKIFNSNFFFYIVLGVSNLPKELKMLQKNKMSS